MKDIFTFFEKPKGPADLEPLRLLSCLARGAGLDLRRAGRGVALRVAARDGDRSWSHGAISTAALSDPKTDKPIAGGLRCPKVFGPVTDYACACGKYTRMKDRGVVCEKCGVEVIASRARRERMAHVPLRAPVTPPSLGVAWSVVPILPPDLRPDGLDALYARLFSEPHTADLVEAIVRAALAALADAVRLPARTDFSGEAVAIVGERHRAPLELLRALAAPLLYGACEALGYAVTIKSSKNLVARDDALARDLLRRVLADRVFLLAGPREELVAVALEPADDPVVEITADTARRLGVRTGDAVSVHLPISDAGQWAAKHLGAGSGAPTASSWIERVRSSSDPIAELLAAARKDSLDPCDAAAAAMFVGGYAPTAAPPSPAVDLTPPPRPEPVHDPNLDRSLGELELSIRTAKVLGAIGLRTIRDLVQKTEADLLKSKNFGRKSLIEVREILATMGLSLGMRV